MLDKLCGKIVELDDGIPFCNLCQQFVDKCVRETRFKLLLDDGTEQIEAVCKDSLFLQIAADRHAQPKARLHCFGISLYQDVYSARVYCADPPRSVSDSEECLYQSR
ncbi:hypothetical protein HDU91_000314 [Kappamyces sp. JEL0680]|nr:hypothetical protein HDU91_000314 [Kappamyces sp. JEL0680]